MRSVAVLPLALARVSKRPVSAMICRESVMTLIFLNTAFIWMNGIFVTSWWTITRWCGVTCLSWILVILAPNQVF